MDALLKAKVTVKPVFAGNQEAASSQLSINKVAAAGVNSAILARYARREGFDYRALWTSELYNDLCIMANPKVPNEKVAAVKHALVDMAKDPTGPENTRGRRRVAEIKDELGFVAAITATTTITVPSSGTRCVKEATN